MSELTKIINEIMHEVDSPNVEEKTAEKTASEEKIFVTDLGLGMHKIATDLKGIDKEFTKVSYVDMVSFWESLK